MSQKQFLKSRFFKLPNHKIFDFPARYYDERKEKLNERIKNINTSDYNQRIKDSFKSKSRLQKIGIKIGILSDCSLFSLF